MKKILLAGLGSISLFAALSASAISPAVLLTIDDSDPTAVKFTATSALPLANTTGFTLNDGVDLLGLFSTDETAMTYDINLPIGNLTGGNSGLAYASAWSDNYTTGGTGAYFDLELYVGNDSVQEGTQSATPQDFSITDPAFTGTWTVNLMALGIDASALPAPGAEGNIIVGFSGHSGAIIGDWQVPLTATPEPSTEGLMAMGALAIGTILYRRKN